MGRRGYNIPGAFGGGIKMMREYGQPRICLVKENARKMRMRGEANREKRTGTK